MRDLLKQIHIGTLIGILVAGYIAVYLIQTVKHNYELQQQIANLHQQVDNLEIDKQALKYKIQYYQTDSYKEKEARAKLGLQAPGENVIILPHQDDHSQSDQGTPPKPHRRNLQQWEDFLLGRGK